MSNNKKKKNSLIKKGATEFLLYTTPNGDVIVEIFLMNETIWLTQGQIAELFGVQRPAITKHLKNIFDSGELDENVVSSILEHTTKHGAIEEKTQTKGVKYYNLDAIISVGYRVNSTRATHFRIWATKILKEYIVKGFAMDDKRLKNPDNIFGKDYFDEQLERIRDIRSSERRFYQKITDIYLQCSSDYDKNSRETQLFFATVQNKLHWAISRQTVAEIVYSRASSDKQNMGLTSWKNAPKGIIRKNDVSIAKNYLDEKELDGLNRIVSMYLDYAEMQAMKRQVMYMSDWVEKLDAFLKFNERDILDNPGKVSAELAKSFAESEFEKYRIVQDRLFESDFDKILKALPKDSEDKIL
ncbi:MAG TPA: cell filamentation protein Fic [Lentisphaeria bacterium]|nr:MAG: cell filamentation protein Fic [Lentisphaerae bacterium GWF2_38_69]HBM15818.1 cell filamentation protein Fic [Lentisphaeria bacterium]